MPGTDINRPLLPISVVGDNPRRLDEVVRTEPDGAGGNIQVPDGDPRVLAEKVRSVRTNDGPVLMFNVPPVAYGVDEVLLPSSPEGLPDDYATLLFSMSSELPAQMAEAAASLGYQVRPSARGFLYNAQAASVVEFLDIGTRPITPGGFPQLPPA